MRKKARKYILHVVVLLAAILFVAKFAGQSALRLYLETGVGSCEKIPILCMAPEEKTVNLDTSKKYFPELQPYKFPEMEIAVPKGFDVVQETMKKVYYKKKKGQHTSGVFYLLYEPPNFFIDLFPQLKKQEIIDNHEFIRRVMYANLEDTANFTDVFFVIMKGIFIPDLGRQENVRMVQFRVADKKGFINYNLSKTDNYFDCNVIDNADNFFKIYIKDRGAKLDLNQVLFIISQVTKRS